MGKKWTRKNEFGLALEGRQRPSRRNPVGAPRCQAIVFDDDGTPRQCRKNAREPYEVCPSHGVGYARREQAGVAKNVALASTKTGTRARPETLVQLRDAHPALRALYEDNLSDDDLFDLRPVLAQSRALSTFLVDNFVNSDSPSPEGALRAIAALTQTTKVAQDLLRIESALGPISHSEMRKFTNGVSEVIRRFVPEGRREEAIAFLRQQIADGS